MLGSVFLQGLVLNQEENQQCFKGKQVCHMTRQKNEKTNGEGKTSGEQVGSNRTKTSPENVIP